MCPLWSDKTFLLFLLFVLKYSTFEEKIEASLIPVLSPGAYIRENMVCNYMSKLYKLFLHREKLILIICLHFKHEVITSLHVVCMLHARETVTFLVIGTYVICLFPAKP